MKLKSDFQTKLQKSFCHLCKPKLFFVDFVKKVTFQVSKVAHKAAKKNDGSNKSSWLGGWFKGWYSKEETSSSVDKAQGLQLFQF